MPDTFRNIFRPSRIAGGLLMWSSVFAYLSEGSLSPVAFVLGIALSATEDTSKLDILRFLVFGWCGISLLMTLLAAVSQGIWVSVIPVVLFTGATAGLMLDGLHEPTIAALALVGFGAVFF